MKKIDKVTETVPTEQPAVAQQPSMENIAELKAYAYDLLADIERNTNLLRQVNTAIQEAQQRIAGAVQTPAA